MKENDIDLKEEELEKKSIDCQKRLSISEIIRELTKMEGEHRMYELQLEEVELKKIFKESYKNIEKTRKELAKYLSIL